MIGLDRAAIWVELEVDADLVTIGIKKTFPGINPKRLSGNTQTYSINRKNINEIRIKEKKWTTMIKIDFSYSRFEKDSNIEPMCDEIKKVIIEEKIIKIIHDITLQDVERDKLYFEYFEYCIQEKVKSFYAFHNIFSCFYRALSRNVNSSKEQIQFNNYDVKRDFFYSTGFIFQINKGWKIRLYSKTHENNKKNIEKIKGASIRLEHRFTKTMIKNLCGTNQVSYLTLNILKDKINKVVGKILFETMIKEIYRDIDILKDKFKEFNSREIKSSIKDYQEHILDEKIINYVITELSDKSERQNKRYRLKIKESLQELQARGSPVRDNFQNIERLNFFINNILMIKLKVKCSYKSGLTFIYK